MRLRTTITLGAITVALVPTTPALAVVDEVDPLAGAAEQHGRQIIAEKQRDKRAKAARVRAAKAARSVAVPGHLQAIAACESGGDPGAVGGGGLYRGKYQFDLQTWRSVGGAGDPASAPEAEQDRRAAMLYAKAGATPWPVCGS